MHSLQNHRSSVSERDKLTPPSKRALVVVAAVAAVLVLALLALLAIPAFWLFVLVPASLPPFDAEAWAAAPDGRLPMAKYICHHDLLDGLDRQEVEAMLGPAEPDQRGEHVLWYAGHDGLDPYYIYVTFDQDGAVETSQLVQH